VSVAIGEPRSTESVLADAIPIPVSELPVQPHMRLDECKEVRPWGWGRTSLLCGALTCHAEWASGMRSPTLLHGTDAGGTRACLVDHVDGVG